jgi:hypothetical protein
MSINLYPANATTTFTVYPESGSLYLTSSYILTVTSDWDQTSGSVSVSSIGSRSALSNRLVLQYTSGSGLPNKTGQYDYDLREQQFYRPTFGSLKVQFGIVHVRFGDLFPGEFSTIDRGLAYIYGINDPVINDYTSSNESGTFTRYSDSQTVEDYISNNENALFTTYNG